MALLGHPGHQMLNMRSQISIFTNLSSYLNDKIKNIATKVSIAKEIVTQHFVLNNYIINHMEYTHFLK